MKNSAPLTAKQHQELVNFGKETGRDCHRVCTLDYSWLAAMTSMRNAYSQILKHGKIAK